MFVLRTEKFFLFITSDHTLSELTKLSEAKAAKKEEEWFSFTWRNFYFFERYVMKCIYYKLHEEWQLLPVAARSKAKVCSQKPTEIAGSNTVGVMDVCLLWLLRLVR
jgi:hypothetical protein